MRRIYSSILVSIFVFLLSLETAYAKSSYVLPYPSAMPGGISYKIHMVLEQFQKYWYFGDFGQFDYNLKESDTYLVEAKILFEYNQYLLGVRALKKSDEYFKKISPLLTTASKNGKNIVEKKRLFMEATLKHVETLQDLKASLPKTVTWIPERGQPTVIPLEQLITSSIEARLSKN